MTAFAQNKPLTKNLLKMSLLSAMVAALSGCGEDAKDCGGFWDKNFGREECAVAKSNPVPVNNNVVAPKIIGVSPAQATVGVTTTFTLTGENLTDAVQVSLPDCDALTITARNSTQITFSCKSLSISTPKLIVSNGGIELFASNINFVVDKSDPTILKGVFVDSVTGGLGYKTDTMSGITDENGTFYYRANETVEFFLGKNSLGEVPATSAVYVYDLNQTITDIYFEKAQKVAQLLQSLDMDANPKNGIMLAPVVQNYFDNNSLDLYVTDEAFAENLQGALSTLTSKKILVSKEEAYNHTKEFGFSIFKTKMVDNDNGDCEAPRNYVSDFNVIDLNGSFVARDDSRNTTTEGLSCVERRMAAMYTNYVFDKQQQQLFSLTGKISKSINIYSEENLDKNPYRKALENSFQTVADTADAISAKNDLADAASVAKAVQASVLLMNSISQTGVSIAKLILSNNENAQEVMEATKDVMDAILNTSACLVDIKHFDVDTCFTAFEKSLEVSAKYIDKKNMNANKEQIKLALKSAAVVLGNVPDIVDGVKAKDYRKVVYLSVGVIAQVQVEAMKAEPNQTTNHKALVKLMEGGIIPITQSVKCVSVLSGADAKEVVKDLGDCLTDVIYKGVVDNLFKIGFYSVANVDLTDKVQDAFEYSVAVAVARDLLHYGYASQQGQERLAAKWGFDPKKFNLDKQTKRIVEILLEQKVADMNWVSRGLREVSLQLAGGGLFHSAIEVNRTTRMVWDILNEVKVYADSDIDKYKITTSIDEQSNGLTVNAKVNFAFDSQMIKANGLSCYATESDYHEGNPYVFDNKAVNFNKDLNLKFEFLHSGEHELVCEAYGQYGRLGRSTRTVVIVQPRYDIKWKVDEDKVLAEQPAHFSLESNGADSPLLVKWQFADSAQAYIADPKEKVAFAFNKAGEYEVTATAIDIFGTTSTYKSSVKVSAGQIMASSTTPEIGESVQFSIQNIISKAKAVIWQFGSDTVEMVADLAHATTSYTKVVVSNLTEAISRVFSSVGNAIVSAVFNDENSQQVGLADALTLNVLGNSQISAVNPADVIRTQINTLQVTGERLSKVNSVSLTGGECGAPTNVTDTTFNVKCRFDIIGNQSLDFYDSKNQKFASTTIAVKTNITAVKWVNNNGTVKFGDTITYTVEGINLTSGMGFAVEKCGVSNTEVGTGTDTERTFQCFFNPNDSAFAGQMAGVVKDTPDGQELFNFVVPVEVAPSTTTSGLLNDTGITQCSNESTLFADCTAASMGGWFGLNQDGETGRDVLAVKGTLAKTGAGDAGFDFTKISATGQTLPANATAWSCVQDNHTGLMWEVKTDDGGTRDKDNTYQWYNTNTATNGGAVGYENGGKNTQAFTQAVNAQDNGQGLCGHNDWRLPSKKELHSIVNYGKYNPAIDTAYFPNTQNNWYLSSSPYADGSYGAWIVDFYVGYDGSYYKGNSYYVRLVRSSQ